MSKKKNKFDLATLVHEGYLKDGEKLAFVSNPSLFGLVQKQPNHEYKVLVGKETFTLHAFSQKCLGQDPPDHASKWFKNEKGTILFDLWSQYLTAQEAA